MALISWASYSRSDKMTSVRLSGSSGSGFLTALLIPFLVVIITMIESAFENNIDDEKFKTKVGKESTYGCGEIHNTSEYSAQRCSTRGMLTASSCAPVRLMSAFQASRLICFLHDLCLQPSRDTTRFTYTILCSLECSHHVGFAAGGAVVRVGVKA